MRRDNEIGREIELGKGMREKRMREFKSILNPTFLYIKIGEFFIHILFNMYQYTC
jgi:hypothetical protein